MRRALTAAVVITAAWLAPSADALTLPSAKLEGSNGYKALIEGFGDQVLVTAKANGAGATYVVDGTVEGDRLEADLGPFGGLALQFVPTESPRAEGRRGCRGGVVEQEGIWHGTIALVAERGFTSAFATAAVGEVVRLKRRCRAAGRGSLDAIAALHVRRRGKRGAVFSAFKTRRQKSYVSATRAHTEDGIRVLDFAGDRVGPGRLRLDRERGRAWVRPHAPFTGEARFRRGAGDEQRWRGDLAVDFPGGGTVPLAGPRFRALIGGAEVALAAASFEGLLVLPF